MCSSYCAPDQTPRAPESSSSDINMQDLNSKIATSERSVVLPRKKGHSSHLPRPVSLDMDSLSRLMDLRQSDAADILGISLTALKCACRRIGLKRWPRSKQTRSDYSVDALTKLQAQSPTNLSVPSHSHSRWICEEEQCGVSPSSNKLEGVEERFTGYQDELFDEAIEHVQGRYTYCGIL
ncbi:hypothetical protein GUITHDRAFT_115842 [Guillardia theta CCMP2712]|uniref:RWP-RK domain-containing protein n=1 Tax=Guillardia theta (strain CCMP2712) TaxID=905079 RepID=L1IQH6_GUITC|nr:hypothetical protein GUITHDRAFT_115842 [Guillardia theta CCMP2712]EKX38080.1 hypothetical protein GUITHDRAFT_115842 [Guillardia theta CCMP2712]|eukprot:XP_005825060.1 hypothetical protein GUITHDRAFT_115842 [Guillardia theta CCMP2712]